MKALLISLLILTISQSIAQTTVPFDPAYWTYEGKVTKETFQGKDGIRLTDGRITLKDNTFKNGIIEFDITLSPDRDFPGFGFRIQDKDEFEHIYLRPHRVGNPDAIQYIPVFHGQDSWQFYYGDGYSTTVNYPMNEWVHIKLVVRGSQAEVYIGQSTEPSLVIHQLKREPKAGRISLENGAPVTTRFANFQYTKTDNPPMVGKFKPEAAPQPGTLLNWQVSSTFDEKLLQANYILPKALASRLTWSDLTAENSGKLNVSRIRKRSEEANTVFVKLTIISDKSQIKKLDLGFSDRVNVYVNERLVYAGHDEFLSRDYRFLGTVGYYDAIFLDLKKGPNELWIAVSENFGGWGVQGLIADQSGLTIKP
ncbi:LamG domain-containing protein [Spirosoma litoris]